MKVMTIIIVEASQTHTEIIIQADTMTTTEISMQMIIITMITVIMRDTLMLTGITMKIIIEMRKSYAKGIDNRCKFGHWQRYCKTAFQQRLASDTCCKACRQAHGT